MVQYYVLVNSSETDPLTDAQEGKDILSISHGVAIILLFSTYPPLTLLHTFDLSNRHPSSLRLLHLLPTLLAQGSLRR